MTSFGWLIATTLILLFVMNLHFWTQLRPIERRLDEEHDYFRYIARESSIMRYLNGVYSNDTPNHWITDYIDKRAELALGDPLLEDMVNRYRRTRAAWFGGFAFWIMIATGLAIATF